MLRCREAAIRPKYFGPTISLPNCALPFSFVISSYCYFYFYIIFLFQQWDQITCPNINIYADPAFWQYLLMGLSGAIGGAFVLIALTLLVIWLWTNQNKLAAEREIRKIYQEKKDVSRQSTFSRDNFISISHYFFFESNCSSPFLYFESLRGPFLSQYIYISLRFLFIYFKFRSIHEFESKLPATNDAYTTLAPLINRLRTNKDNDEKW